MSMVLTAAVLLMISFLSFGVDVQIVMKSEPWSELDTAPHMKQAEEKLYGNPCISKKTCGKCVRHPDCAWCALEDMNYNDGGRKRCNYRDIIEEECGERDAVFDIENIHINDSRGYIRYERNYEEMNVVSWYYAERDLPFVEYKVYGVPENVKVTEYAISCSGDKPIPANKDSCTDVKKDDYVYFEMYLKVHSCPENRIQWNPILQLHILEGADDVVIRKVNLGILCKCPCEMPENHERNSPKCSGRGTYECGICSCPNNWYGKECECEGKPTADDDDDDDDNKACIAPGDTKICSGRGRCCSGICQCLNKTCVSGRFCECDSYSCPRSEDGQICGGKDHGKCVCGRCECTDEWTGPACNCTKDIVACRSPYNGLLCHGFGECKCGQCQCFTRYGNLHKGRYCEKCPLHCLYGSPSNDSQEEKFRGC